MSIQPIPAPTATMLFLNREGHTQFGPIGVDLVCIPEEGMARVLVPLPSGLVWRLGFTRDQLAALMDELCELADVIDQQAQQLGQAELQLASMTPVVACHDC